MIDSTFPSDSEQRPVKVLLMPPMGRQSYRWIPIPPFPDVGLGYIASACTATGAEVNLLSWHQNLSIEELRNYIKTIEPDLVGIKVFTLFLREAKATLQAVRAAAPQAVIVIGGPHTSTSVPKDLFLEFDGLFDFAVMGDGEHAIAGLLKAHVEKDKQAFFRQAGTLPGLIYRQNGKIFKTPPDFTVDLDTLPPVDWSLQQPAWFRGQIVDGSGYFAPVMDSRGCPAHCGFCECSVINGAEPRYRSVDRVCEEIDALVGKFGVRKIALLGNSFVSDTSYIREFCNRLIDRGNPVEWVCTGAAYEMSLSEPGLLALMHQAGCRLINFGIESGSERIRQLLRQPVPLSAYAEIIQGCHMAGITPVCSFMFGLADETVADMWKTIRFAFSLPEYCCIEFNICLPMPGTICYQATLERHRLERINWETYNFNTPRLLPSRASAGTVHIVFLAAKMLNKIRVSRRRERLLDRG